MTFETLNTIWLKDMEEWWCSGIQPWERPRDADMIAIAAQEQGLDPSHFNCTNWRDVIRSIEEADRSF